MATAKVDSKKRIVLPNGRPGDIYEILQTGEGQLILVRLERPEPVRMSRAESIKAMEKAPLQPTVSWEELRRVTREL